MTCPAWEPLVAARESDLAVEPAGWREALAHAESCPGCRRRALALEPTLVFRRLPSPAGGEVDVAAMQAAVAALVRARRIERPEAAPRRAGWRRAAIAAAGLVALVLQAGPRPPAAPADRAAAVEAGAPSLVAAPVFEQLGGSDARVYQLPAEGYSVVMIVDSSFDV